MRRILLPLFFISIHLQLLAQQGGLGLVVGIPQNEFRESTRAEGYGLNLYALFPLGTEVINFGGQIDYMIYGLNAQNKTLRADITSGSTTIGSLDIPLRIINTNSIFGMHAIMRITAPTEGVRPYFEGLFGFRYISTSTRIEDNSDNGFWSNNDDEDDNTIVRKTNLGDFVMSYGGGAGLQLKMGENAYLDLRGYYLLGGKAQYYDADDTRKWTVEFTDLSTNYDPDNLDPNDFSIASQPKESTTDMLMVQLGATFKF